MSNKLPDPDVPSFLLRFKADDLIMSSTRYFLGRMTACAGAFAKDLADAWPHIPSDLRTIIRRDIRDKFEDDDRARELGRDGVHDPLPLGMDCDRQMWEVVRSAWKEQDAAEEAARLQEWENAKDARL